MRALALRLDNPAEAAKPSTKKRFQFLSGLPADFQAILLPRYGRHAGGQGAVSGELRKEIKRYADHFFCT
jgi:hypothetical protein